MVKCYYNKYKLKCVVGVGGDMLGFHPRVGSSTLPRRSRIVAYHFRKCVHSLMVKSNVANV